MSWKNTPRPAPVAGVAQARLATLGGVSDLLKVI